MRRKSDGKIVLIDFGVVKQITTQVVNSQGQTHFTVVIGSRGYMPCEQADGNSQFSSDIYAVGIIGIQALTGIFPVNLSKDSQTGEIVWRKCAQVSSKLADILDKMVRYDYRQRYQSADEALQALKTLFPDTSVANQRQKQPDAKVPTTKPPTQALGIPNKLFIGSGIAAVFATTIAAIYIFKPPTPENFLQYENPSIGIKIKYPQSWERQDINNPITGGVVTFVSPKQSDADKFQEKVTLSVEDFPGTLQEFTNLSIKEINNNMSKTKIIKQSEASFAKKQGKELVFTGKDGENSLQNLQFFTLRR
jgi:serine/threonine-protein kinase